MAAINVDSVRRSEHSRKTGLRPMAMEIGTQIKAPIPQNTHGTEDNTSSRRGAMSYVVRFVSLWLGEVPLGNIHLVVHVGEDSCPALGPIRWLRIQTWKTGRGIF